MFEALIIMVGILLIIAAFGDIKNFKIPNWIPASIVLLYVGAFVISVLTNFIDAPIQWLPSIAIAISLLIAFTFLFSFGHMGGGDVKLIAATSLWAGPALVTEFLLGMALAGGVLSLLLIIKTKLFKIPTAIISNQNSNNFSAPSSTPMPYGVAIAAGGLIVVQKLFLGALNQAL